MNSFENQENINLQIDAASNQIADALWPRNRSKQASQTRTISPKQARNATEETSRDGRHQPIGNLKDINDVHAIYQQIKNRKKGSVDVRSLMKSQGGQRQSSQNQYQPKPDWKHLQQEVEMMLLDGD